MTTIEQYQQYFRPEEIPDSLAKLIEFADTQRDWFSQGFELECDLGDVMFKSFSENPEFVDSLFAIGQADSTGSTYAIWRQSGALSDAPIVVFGGEGGAHVVANNLLELFRILTLDAEPIISWDEVTFYKPESDEPSEGAATYVEWLGKNFNARPVKDASEVAQIVSNAQIAHEKRFQDWFKQFSG